MLARFEARMLSGEPFTQEGLEQTFGRSAEDARLIRLRIQELRREGLIEYQRHGLRLIWVATDTGKRKLKQEEPTGS
jgi:hypothetical protein